MIFLQDDGIDNDDNDDVPDDLPDIIEMPKGSDFIPLEEKTSDPIQTKIEFTFFFSECIRS